MAVKIRLQRRGAKHDPFFRMVAADGRSPRDGRFVELLGTYNPTAKKPEDEANLKVDRIDYWLSVGAQPSHTARSIIRRVKKMIAEAPTETAPVVEEVAPPAAESTESSAAATAGEAVPVATAEEAVPVVAAEEAAAAIDAPEAPVVETPVALEVDAKATPPADTGAESLESIDDFFGPEISAGETPETGQDSDSLPIAESTEAEPRAEEGDSVASDSVNGDGGEEDSSEAKSQG
jgi:small subunit ribosomal protein S16